MIDLSFFLFYNYIGGTMKKIIVAILLIILITGCNTNKDNIKFKEEYESLNDTLTNITIKEDNYMKYIDKDEVIKTINKGTGVIYIGSASNNECREMINILIEAADSTDIKTIYYYNDEDTSFLSNYVENTSIPLVLFVYEGKITSYKQGISNKEELLDVYLDGIHEVLNDICNEECND